MAGARRGCFGLPARIAGVGPCRTHWVRVPQAILCVTPDLGQSLWRTQGLMNRLAGFEREVFNLFAFNQRCSSHAIVCWYVDELDSLRAPSHLSNA